MSDFSRRCWITLGSVTWFAHFACKRQRSPVAETVPASAGLLPDFGQLPSFQLIDHMGRPFTNSHLDGNVWIVDFIFTRCTAVCPRLTHEMAALQTLTAATPKVGLLSISIDPDYDTITRLAEFASRYHADPARWRFLTGDKTVIRQIQVKTQRHLDPEEITSHSQQFYLIDNQGYIREIYSMTQPGRREEIVADLARLIASPTRPQPVPEV
ncbi:MAG: SCO family protein [Acidobacteria bacterium]|nr:SCO family protein [Acidobacteriota bacterium]